MAFGKVVVETEAGVQEIVELENPTTSIGRQEGNDIVLKTTAVSRYHAQFDVAEGQVFLVDLGSVNGTFINDQQVEPNSRSALSEGDIITLGDVRLVFYPRMIRPTQSLIPETNTIEAEGIPFRLILETPLQPVAPSARMRLFLVIENLSEGEVLYDVTVGGLDPTWVTLNRQQVRLEAGEQGEVVVSIRPPRTSHTRPGIYALKVRVSLADDPTVSMEAVREIDIVGYAAFGMILQNGRRGGHYQVVMQNQGNVPLSIWLSGYDRRDTLRFKFDPAQTDLEPGETKQVRMTISGGDAAGGQPLPFAVVAHSMDEAGYQAPLIGYHTPGGASGPMLSGGLGLPVLALGGAAIVLLLGVLLVASGVLGQVLGAGPKGPATEDPAIAAALTLAAASDTPIVPTPTLLVIETPTLTPVPTFTPTSIPLSEREPDVILDMTTNPNIAPVLATLGQAWVVGFRWNLPEGATNPILLDSNNTSFNLTEADFAAGIWRTDLVSLVQKVGYEPHAFRLTYMDSTGALVTQHAAIDVNAQPCELATGTVMYEEPRLDSVQREPLPSPTIVILGRYLDSAGDEWLRIAAHDPANLSTLLLFNQRWVSYLAVVACGDLSPANFDEYVLLDPIAIPR